MELKLSPDTFHLFAHARATDDAPELFPSYLNLLPLFLREPLATTGYQGTVGGQMRSEVGREPRGLSHARVRVVAVPQDAVITSWQAHTRR
jgi:hypothetical protein